MKQFEDRECENCPNQYTPTGPAARFCSSCRVLKKKESRERDKAKRRTGVGSGNSPFNKGKLSPVYKNGIGQYKKIRDEKLKQQGYKCNRCDETADISNYNPYKWCGHHIDHDRTNNEPDNIEVICKRCHQIEHECWKAFEGATTIPKGSTHKCVEAPTTER
jgi:hypothetical protein